MHASYGPGKGSRAVAASAGYQAHFRMFMYLTSNACSRCSAALTKAIASVCMQKAPNVSIRPCQKRPRERSWASSGSIGRTFDFAAVTDSRQHGLQHRMSTFQTFGFCAFPVLLRFSVAAGFVPDLRQGPVCRLLDGHQLSLLGPDPGGHHAHLLELVRGLSRGRQSPAAPAG